MSDIDTLGVNQEHRPNWMERAERLARPELFHAEVNLRRELWSYLSPQEQATLHHHLDLIQQWAKYMAAGMMKGVLKYDGRPRPVDDWMSNLLGEAVDVANYQMLMYDAWRTQHEREV